MHQRLYAILFLLIALTVAGCKTPVLEQLGTFMPAPPQPSFEESLARGYGLLAQYEEFNIGNVAAAAHFREKSRLGGQALPDNPAQAKLSRDDSKEMTVAYGMLTHALEAGSAQSNGMKMAEAHLNFDCWLERQSGSEKAAGLSTAQWCRERFYTAIESLAHSGPKYFIVYFDNNTAIPDASAIATIRQASAAYMEHEPDDWHIRLTGRSDTKGDKEQNMVLSMRRALAVRNVLAQNGVDPGQITIAATGGEKKRHTDADETRQGRRVDIAVIPRSMDRPEKGEPDITKIMPQYFGPDGPNM